jgi:hypothetical protein
MSPDIMIGYHITVLIRNAFSIIPHDKLTVVVGSVMSHEDMQRAFAAGGIPVDAVLQFLNPLRTSDNPWAKFLGPPRLLADSTASVARVLLQQKRSADTAKPRLVVMNAVGVGRSRQVTPWIARFLIDHSNVGKTCEDHTVVSDEIEDN